MRFSLNSSLRRAAFVGGLAGVAFASTVYPGPGPTLDSLEFQTAVTVLGVVHPPGSPLYLLLGKLFTLVFPFGEVALRLNLFSAATGALTVGLVFLLIETLTSNPLSAAFGSLVLAFAPQFWYQATIAEIWSLNAAFLAALLYCWMRWLDEDQPRWYWAALGVYALSLGNHASMILLLPALILSGLLHRPRFLLHPRTLALSAAFGLLGALVYGYVPLRAASALFCNYCPRDPTSLLDYFTASPFRGAFFGVSWADLPAHALEAGARLLEQFGVAVVALGVVGAWQLARGDKRRSALFFTALAAEAAFGLTYNVPDWPEFLSPTFLLFAVLIGVGTAAVLRYVGSRTEGRRKQVAAGLALLAIAALVGGQFITSYKVVRGLRDPFLRNWSASFIRVVQPGGWVMMPPVGSPAFKQAWALRYRAWARKDSPEITLIAPPDFTPPGPPPGYLAWETALPELSTHTLYALTLDDPRLQNQNLPVTEVRGPGGDLLGYQIEWPP